MSIGKKTLVATTLVLGIAPAAMAVEMPPPSATDFAAMLMSSTATHAKAHGDPQRIARPDCVSPKPGLYMCSYAVQSPSRPDSCHLMQARWTPTRSSVFTVTLAGRTHSCANLSDAIHSLD